MTLGERICALRTEHSLSQSDLAERLGVSRQSISKWETDASIPDLDKLVKMCRLFGMSIDELVLGEPPTASKADLDAPLSGVLTLRMAVALALMAFGLLALLLMSAVTKNVAIGISLSLPFLICAVLFFKVKRHLMLYCGWVVWISIDIGLRMSEGWGILDGLLFVLGGSRLSPGMIVALAEWVFLVPLLTASVEWIQEWYKKITEAP